MPELNQPQTPVVLGDDAKSKLLAAAQSAAGSAELDHVLEPIATPTPEPTVPKAQTPTPSPIAPAKTETVKAAEPEKPKGSEGMKNLRDALDRAHSKLKDLEESGTATTKQLAEATTKMADVANRLSQKEEEIEKTYKPIALKLNEREKKLQEVEERLRIRDYVETSDYYDKYEKPLAAALGDSERLLKRIEVTDVNGQPRMASTGDLSAVIEAKTLNEKIRRAKAIFGDDVHQTIVNEAVRIENLAAQREEGRKNAALDSAKYMERQQQSQAQFREAVRNKMLSESELRLKEYAPTEGDEEMGSAYREALEFADKSISGDPAWTGDQLASTLGRARAEIVAANVLRKQVSRLKTERDSLLAKLKSYEASEPDVQPRNSGAPPKPESNTREDVRKRLEQAAIEMSSR